MRLGRQLALLAALGICALPARADLAQGLSAVAKRDWRTAAAQFKPLAERGDPDAQVNLGNLYMKGHGVEQDYQAAFGWYLKAADQGSPLAQGKLGMMRYYGLGEAADHAAAARWFQKAAEQGEPGSAALLGSLCEAGDGVKKDPVRALFWDALAGSLGHRSAGEAQRELADQMNPGEINQAMDLLAEWEKRHPLPAVAESGPRPPLTDTAGEQGGSPKQSVPHGKNRQAPKKAR